MKNRMMMRLIFAFALLLCLSSCKEQSQTLTRDSPSGKVHITITTLKKSIADDLAVTMTIKSGDIPPGSLMFQLPASTLDDSNMKLDWSGDSVCRLTFTQSDDEHRTFRITATETNVTAYEVKEGGN